VKRLPTLPTWLLKQLGCSTNNDAVLGDLAERYRTGWGASEELAVAFEFILACTVPLVLGFASGLAAVLCYRKKRAVVLLYILVVQSLATAMAFMAPEFRPAYAATINLSATLGILLAAFRAGTVEGSAE
jgi:hypothetical protein